MSAPRLDDLIPLIPLTQTQTNFLVEWNDRYVKRNAASHNMNSVTNSQPGIGSHVGAFQPETTQAGPAEVSTTQPGETQQPKKKRTLNCFVAFRCKCNRLAGCSKPH